MLYEETIGLANIHDGVQYKYFTVSVDITYLDQHTVSCTLYNLLMEYYGVTQFFILVFYQQCNLIFVSCFESYVIWGKVLSRFAVIIGLSRRASHVPHSSVLPALFLQE